MDISEYLICFKKVLLIGIIHNIVLNLVFL